MNMQIIVVSSPLVNYCQSFSHVVLPSRKRNANADFVVFDAFVCKIEVFDEFFFLRVRHQLPLPSLSYLIKIILTQWAVDLISKLSFAWSQSSEYEERKRLKSLTTPPFIPGSCRGHWRHIFPRFLQKLRCPQSLSSPLYQSLITKPGLGVRKPLNTNLGLACVAGGSGYPGART